jgi:hypothetical protein
MVKPGFNQGFGKKLTKNTKYITPKTDCEHED